MHGRMVFIPSIILLNRPARPFPARARKRERGNSAYAFSIVSETAPAASTTQEVECPAEKDLTLHLLRRAVGSGNWATYRIWYHVLSLFRRAFGPSPTCLWRESYHCARKPLDNALLCSHKSHQGMVHEHAKMPDSGLKKRCGGPPWIIKFGSL